MVRCDRCGVSGDCNPHFIYGETWYFCVGCGRAVDNKEAFKW